MKSLFGVTAWFRSGTPWIWLNAGAIALCLVMVIVIYRVWKPMDLWAILRDGLRELMRQLRALRVVRVAIGRIVRHAPALRIGGPEGRRLRDLRDVADEAAALELMRLKGVDEEGELIW